MLSAPHLSTLTSENYLGVTARVMVNHSQPGNRTDVTGSLSLSGHACGHLPFTQKQTRNVTGSNPACLSVSPALEGWIGTGGFGAFGLGGLATAYPSAGPHVPG